MSLVGGLLATTVGAAIAFAVATLTYRLGADPDNTGIPVVTACSDLVGAFSLILALVLLGLT